MAVTAHWRRHVYDDQVAHDICLRCWKLIGHDDHITPCDGYAADAPVQEELPFEIIVKQAYDRLPRQIDRALRQRGVGVMVGDRSPADGDRPSGIAFGVWSPALHAIFIYETACRVALDMPLSERVYRVLWHEIGHVLGLDHETLAKEYEL